MLTPFLLIPLSLPPVPVCALSNRSCVPSRWVKELQRQGSANIVIALAGNKLDLADQRQVDIEEAKAYADDNNIQLLETSAKSNTNVTEIFKQIAIALPKNTASTAAGRRQSRHRQRHHQHHTREQKMLLT